MPFGWFKKSDKRRPVLSAEVNSERYDRKPLLVVLECYVLDCIGKLSPDKQHKMKLMVQKVWGGSDDWKATVRQQLELGESIDQSIQTMWSKNQAIASNQGIELHETSFTKMLVDENFADMID